MNMPVQSLNVASWHTLKEQAAPNLNQGGDLPSISPNSPAWGNFKRNADMRTPYVSQLNESIRGIHQFIEQHAAPGTQRKIALGNLQHMLQAKVNCRPSDLSPLMINENRRNLNLFVQQLSNPAIPLAQKLGAALSMAQGLGVCTEGETLNILESTQQLCQQQTGLAGLLVNTKNTLIEQHLQALVQHEDQAQMRANLAKELEIHHIQALKNHVAGEWGLGVVEDRHATQAYQEQVGDMAASLLRQTITPALLANTVADSLAQALVNHTASSIQTGMPADQLKTEPLRRAIQAEFGNSIELENCLEFNDDYTEVRLKPQAELALLAMKTFQEIGLIHANADPKELLRQAGPNITKAIKSVDHLRGTVSSHLRNDHTGDLLSGFWMGHVNGIGDTDRKRKERNSLLISAHH
ncbi:hypothetical protein [Limnobacter parvus]|uniref:Uncharacterized protein n=1 Tax=Limnobacter parvus TaxID=2939690 RepID=A0ABT1XCT3_9BURK|nr:hypothetical protein [Limnobacter parvus]MCR2745093.1 hypothetical protein [Limnobacter parvus]